MRIRNESIMVRLPDGSGPAAPLQFVWRERLWRVHAVQRSWVEAGAWWENHERAGDDPLAERRVWRVEASVGAAGAVGVYEVSCRGHDWRLRAVID